ncbi:quinone oxidoreductase family protein [Pseudomonas sp. B22129]|uniref:quinone oxidoreductase family protein n=1 Tax=Pseudomonas sp. B22129 TaxID=3235111 RepID=UPI003783809B
MGVVDAVGTDVIDFKPGDRVAYAGLIGSYSEARLVCASRLVHLPDSISDEVGATLMLRGITAQVLLRQVYKVTPGDTILVHAAAGGLGLMMCQWAASLGVTVIGTVSNEEKAEIARAHGCHHTINYSRENFVERVCEITNGAMLPVVYDSVGKDTFAQSLDCLQPRGLMVISGSASGPAPLVDPAALAHNGSLFLTRAVVFNYTTTRAGLDAAAADLFDAIATKKLKISINQRYPLSEAAQAHHDLESRCTTGATILTV